jgi:hypothetical protein
MTDSEVKLTACESSCLEIILENAVFITVHSLCVRICLLSHCDYFVKFLSSLAIERCCTAGLHLPDKLEASVRICG